MFYRITRLLRLTQFIALVLGFGLGGLLYYFLVDFETVSRRVEHSQEVLDNVQQVRLDSLRAGTWLRSYGVHPSPVFLPRVRTAAAKAEVAAARLEILTVDDPSQNKRAQALRSELSEVLDIYLASADVAEQEGPGALKDMTVAQVSSDITGGLRSVLNQMEKEERRLLTDRSETSRQRLERIKHGLMLSAVLFGVVMLWSIKYSSRMLKASEEKVGQLQTDASVDPLTGLLNRRGLQEYLEKGFASDASDAAILAFDLDDFKPVNDRYSHAAGDQVLKMVAHRLQQQSRSGDAVARIGGDEFIVILSSVTSRQHAVTIAERIQSCIARPIQLAEADVCVNASIGVALMNKGIKDVDTLMSLADQHMYSAKKSGKGQVHAGNG